MLSKRILRQPLSDRGANRLLYGLLVTIAVLMVVEDASRSEYPLHYDEQQREQLVVTAKTKPETLGLAFGHGTVDRLVEYVNNTLSIPISRSQLAEVLTQEGLK